MAELNLQFPIGRMAELNLQSPTGLHGVVLN
jgi:hypothetical protein